MRRLFILAFVLNVLLVVAPLPFLPGTVATHFGEAGEANGWMPLMNYACFMLVTDLFLFLAIYYSPWLMRKLPRRLMNMPNKDYWFAEERADETLAKVAAMTWEIGAVLFLFMFAIGLLVVLANLAEPVRLDMRLFWPALALLLCHTLYWTIKFYRAFRLPEDASPWARGG